MSATYTKIAAALLCMSAAAFASAATWITASSVGFVSQWGSLPPLANREALCRLLETPTNCSSWVYVELSSRSIDAFREAVECTADYTDASVLSLCYRLVRSVRVVSGPGVFGGQKVYIADKKPKPCVGTFSPFGRVADEEMVLYRPRLISPREKCFILARVHVMSEEEAKTMKEAYERVFPELKIVYVDENGQQKPWKRPKPEKRNVVKPVLLSADPVCLFVVEPCPESSSEEYLGPIVLTKREASEMMYVVLGAEAYAKCQLPQGFSKVNELISLNTHLGKDLHFYRTHPKELEQLREDVDYSLKVATGVLPVSDKSKKGSNSRAQPMNVQDSKKLEGAKL